MLKISFKKSQKLWAGSLIGFVVAGVTMTAAASEITVMSSGGLTTVLKEMAPSFERTTGHHVTIVSGPSMGTTEEAIPNRLKRGEPADLVLIAGSSLGDLIDQGVVRKDSRVDIAKSNIGIAIRAGAPKPDISTPEKLKAVLLAAQSVAYSDGASGAYIESELYKKLGIESELKPKSRMIAGARVGDIVAKGEAEIGFQQVSELLPIKGITFVGPLPQGVDKTTVFAAGIPTKTTATEAAKALIDVLVSEEGRTIATKTGLQPIHP